MALQRFVAVNFLIAAISLLVIKPAFGQSGDKTPDLRSLSDADLKTLIIQLERLGCYGSCPAYSVTIHGDGRVEYDGKGHVKATGAREGRIEIDKIRALASKFAEAKFWEVTDDHTQEKCKGRFCTDMATAITAVTIGGITHRVKHYYGCGNAPRSLFELESSIDKSANSEQWTGDVSKAGPYGTTCFVQN